MATDRCSLCGNLTGWGLMALDHHGKPTIPLCRGCQHCTNCNRPFPASELQEIIRFDMRGDRDDDLHLECEGCRG